jgi:drug/metabolite transporter (DMT)-like permease
MNTILIWLLLCLIWGTTWIFIKVGLADLPPISFAGIRFVIASVVLLLVIYWEKIELPKSRRLWTIIIISGILQFFFNYGLLFWGEQHISSGLAAVLQATIPAFGLILARVYVPEEKITLLKIASIVFGISGVAVIFKEQLQLGGMLSLLGSLAVVVGAFMAAYASVLTKVFGRDTHPASLVFGQMFAGLIPLCVVGFIREGNPLNFRWTMSAAICVLYLAIVGSIIAFWLYYNLLGKIDVTKAMMIAVVTPVIAVIIGALYLGEKLAIQTLFGGLLVLASVGLMVRNPLRK